MGQSPSSAAWTPRTGPRAMTMQKSPRAEGKDRRELHATKQRNGLSVDGCLTVSLNRNELLLVVEKSRTRSAELPTVLPMPSTLLRQVGPSSNIIAPGHCTSDNV